MSDCLLSQLSPSPPLLVNTHVPVPLVNPHPPLPHTHTHTPTQSTLECTEECEGNDTIHQTLKPGQPGLMNGHSDTQTKLGLTLYYMLRSKVTQSTDRSRNQRWMPDSLFQTLNHYNRDLFTLNLTMGFKKTCTQAQLLFVIYLHNIKGALARACTTSATQEQRKKKNDSGTQR